MSQPQTVDDWVKLARRHKAAAQTALHGNQPNEAWSRSGFAVECALKAAYLAYKRPNSFPTPEERPEFYKHNLHKLMEACGIDRTRLLRDPIAPKWLTVLLWKRGDDYELDAMPMKRAENMVDSACGPYGVLEWLSSRFSLRI